MRPSWLSNPSAPARGSMALSGGAPPPKIKTFILFLFSRASFQLV